MKMNEVKEGEIFCIEGTKTYPKLKLKEGYVDMRDEIVQRHPREDLDCQLMTEEEINYEFSKCEMDADGVKWWKEKLLENYN